MATKIESHLSPEQLLQFFRRCAQTKGGTKLATIQAIAEEFGVSISLMSASAVRDGPLSDYLEDLKRKSEMAESVAALAKNGAGLSDGAAAVFAEKVFDAAMRIDAGEIGTKAGNNLSLAISRLRSGDQRAKYLEAKLREIEQKLELQQFDAAAAVIEHAKEIRAIVADKALDGNAQRERVRKLLFGEKPEGFTPVSTKGDQTT